MSALNHNHIASEMIMAFHDGELDAVEAGRVAAHIEGCATCRRELELFRRAGSLIAALPTPHAHKPPFSLIRKRAAALQTAPLRTPRRWHIHIHNAVRPLLATAAALIIVLTLLFIRTPGGEPADSFDKADTCMVEQETDAIVRGYDNLPALYK